jgi:hypothetical protein
MDDTEWIEIRGRLEVAASLSNTKKIAVWFALDCPAPPLSAYKQELIKQYAKHYRISKLVETGTYLGDMVDATKDVFDDVYSIELSEDLYINARQRFKKYRSVHLFNGDSGEIITEILKKLKKPAIFWLDAHYSEGITAKGKLNTPIVEEVKKILDHKIKNHIILIDDSRIFNGTGDYPTIESLEKKFLKVLPRATFSDRHDIIRIQPDDSFVEV